MSQNLALSSLEDKVSDIAFSIRDDLNSLFYDKNLDDDLIFMLHDIAGEEIRNFYLLFKRLGYEK